MWLDNRLQFHLFGILHLIPYLWLRTTCTSFSPLSITLFFFFPPYISSIKMTMVHFCCSDFFYKEGLRGLTKDLVQNCNNYNIVDCYHKTHTHKLWMFRSRFCNCCQPVPGKTVREAWLLSLYCMKYDSNKKAIIRRTRYINHRKHPCGGLCRIWFPQWRCVLSEC